MILCQNCTSSNPLTREFCWKCGSRLLVASGPQQTDYTGAVVIDEHLLERISVLEYSLNSLSRRVDSLAETVERLAASNFIDHAMLETVTESLESTGITLKGLEEQWRRKLDHKIMESEEADRLSDRMRRILDSYKGADRPQFQSWMDRAYEFLTTDRHSESIDLLEAGHREHPQNHELALLLAEIYFQNLNFPKALERLEASLAENPVSFEATLLRGLIAQRRGEDRARALLEAAVHLRPKSAAAHAALGSLFADMGEHQSAVEHLERSLSIKPTAAVHYVLGSIYYRDGNAKRTMAHLKAATRLDPHFGEAFYQLGLLCLEKNWLRKAHDYIRTARNLSPSEGRYRRTMRTFAKAPAGAEPLSGMIREELHWIRFSGSKRKD